MDESSVDKYAQRVEEQRQAGLARNRRDDEPNTLVELMESGMHWIPTVSREWIDIRSPQPEKIKLGDIAHACSKEQRYCNQTFEHYSVADHCIILSKCVPDEIKMLSLLHDSAEAYTGDLTAPIKQDCPEFKAIEARFESAIAEALNFPALREHCPLLKVWDRNLKAIELKHFWGLPGEWFQGGPNAYDDYVYMTEVFKKQLKICPDWQASKSMFFERYATLSCQSGRSKKGHLATADAELDRKKTDE